jgi:formylglycine-generating enzyme required for sulfatase activity
MHGNVWEWTSDFYAEPYPKKAAVDPTGPGPSDDDRHPIRGGCWEAVGGYCRAAHRYGEDSSTRDDFTGFRVVLVLPG